MTVPELNLITIVFGLGIFAVIVAVGWRSVQNRRLLRIQSANGQETIILAREGDDISGIVATTQPTPVPTVVVVNAGNTDPVPASNFGKRETVIEA